MEKLTLTEWIKHPTTILLVLAVTGLQMFIQRTIRRSDVRSEECMEQVMYLRGRVEVLEEQADEYTKAVLFKDMQIKKQSQLIDSLYRKENEK